MAGREAIEQLLVGEVDANGHARHSEVGYVAVSPCRRTINLLAKSTLRTPPNTNGIAAEAAALLDIGMAVEFEAPYACAFAPSSVIRAATSTLLAFIDRIPSKLSWLERTGSGRPA